MIKLIASDIDGTLLPIGQERIPAHTLELIEALLDKGVIFCPASGRQLPSIEWLFGDLSKRCSILCDCGAAAWHGGKCLTANPFPREIANEIIADIQAQTYCEALISTVEHRLYFFPKDWDPTAHILDQQGSRKILVENAGQIEGELLRISAYCRDGGAWLDSKIGEKWRSRGVCAAVGHPFWMDFTMSDKGQGLVRLCEVCGISLADVAAIGVSYNDLPMLSVVGHPWLMDIASPVLKEQFPGRVCHSVDEVLERYLRELD